MTGSKTSFTEDEIMVIKQLEKKISEDEALQQQLKNGAKHAVEATFRQVALPPPLPSSFSLATFSTRPARRRGAGNKPGFPNTSI